MARYIPTELQENGNRFQKDLPSNGKTNVQRWFDCEIENCLDVFTFRVAVHNVPDVNLELKLIFPIIESIT